MGSGQPAGALAKGGALAAGAGDVMILCCGALVLQADDGGAVAVAGVVVFLRVGALVLQANFGRSGAMSKDNTLASAGAIVCLRVKAMVLQMLLIVMAMQWLMVVPLLVQERRPLLY